MSQLRAPAARSDRREGGRHGRPGARSLPSPGRSPSSPGRPDTRIRPQLLRAAVLPAVVATLSGAAAVTFVLQAASPEPTFTLWFVLLGAASLAAAAVVSAAVGAERTAASLLARASALRRGAARGQAELRTAVDGLRRGEAPPARRAAGAAPRGGDEFDLLAHELGRSHQAALAAVVQASRLSSSVGNEQKVEVFVNLARRLQSLVHREIQLLDELENEVEDPELLKGLFHVDHLATRIRRHAENLAVLGGAISRRQWSNPVTMTEVLRSAIAEVEQYPRVKLVPPIDGTLRGHAVADVIHLLAELVENATLFSAPHTQVLMRAQHVTAGLAVEVEDRGLGMPAEEQERMNALLTDPDQVNVGHLLQDGRIGLFVVSALARRHGIAVRLQSNIYGGVQAVLVLPQGLLGPDPAAAAPEGARATAVASADAATAPPRLPQPPPAEPPGDRFHGEHARGTGHAGGPGPHPGPGRAGPPAGTAQPLPAQREPAREPGTGPDPLPVRGDYRDRPSPAGARPGAAAPPAHPAHPAPMASAPAGHPEPDPATAPVRGAEGRPRLPRRRSQEHLVPQLREAPATRREDEHTLHDPGLMAAFQRGIVLAESAHDTARPAPAQPLQHRHDPTTKE
ncbi:sensor histidine kinase [Streptomyces sp. NPDC048001]|uniref:sensor histidine kinase n=1 Tax=Streptomyces sp. NPDC048001 TaxID=3365498 RepID=UPI003721CA6D